MTDSLMKTGNLDADNVKTQKEDSRPQAKERDLEQIVSSKPSEKANPANTLISGI